MVRCGMVCYDGGSNGLDLWGPPEEGPPRAPARAAPQPSSATRRAATHPAAERTTIRAASRAEVWPGTSTSMPAALPTNTELSAECTAMQLVERSMRHRLCTG